MSDVLQIYGFKENQLVGFFLNLCFGAFFRLVLLRLSFSHGTSC